MGRCCMKRFDSYASALSVLKTAHEQDLANEFIQGGVIDKFFVQFELGWKLFKQLLSYEGDPVSASGSPRDIIKAAYRFFDCMDEDTWLCMLRDRNNTSHEYDSSKARALVDVIIERYIPEFQRVEDGLRERYGELLDRM